MAMARRSFSIDEAVADPPAAAPRSSGGRSFSIADALDEPPAPVDTRPQATAYVEEGMPAIMTPVPMGQQRQTRAEEPAPFVPQDERTTAGAMGRKFVRGVTDTAALAPKGAAALGYRVEGSVRDFGDRQLEVMDRIDRGGSIPDQDDAAGYQYMRPDQRARARAEAEAVVATNRGNPQTPIEQRGTYKAGEAIEDFGRTRFPTTRAEDEAFWTGQIPHALGSTAAMAPIALAGAPFGALGRLLAGAGISLTGSGEATSGAIQRRRDIEVMGAAADQNPAAYPSDRQVADAAGQGLGPGALDAAAMDNLLRPIVRVPGFRGLIAAIAKKAAEQGVVEGTTEGLQQVAQNLIQRFGYDPSQQVLDEVAENVLVGGVVGVLTGGLAGGMMRPQRGAASQQTPAQGQQATPPQEQAPVVSRETPPPSQGGARVEPTFDMSRLPPVDLSAYVQGTPTEAPASQVSAENAGGISAPVPPAPSGPAPGSPEDFAAVMDDPRPVAEIMAERQARAARDATIAAVTAEDGPDAAAAIGKVLDGQGTRTAPVQAETAFDVEAAAKLAAEPTPAQAEAGNFRHGHVTVQGLDISIETPEGGVRTGIGADGRPWSSVAPAHYGYFKTGQKTGDGKVDVFIGDVPAHPHVTVIDQIDPATGKFDEPKVMLGFDSPIMAEAAYTEAFADGSGPARMGAATRMTIPDLKTWLAKGDPRKPLAYVQPPPARKFSVDDAIAEPPIQSPAVAPAAAPVVPPPDAAVAAPGPELGPPGPAPTPVAARREPLMPAAPLSSVAPPGEPRLDGASGTPERIANDIARSIGVSLTPAERTDVVNLMADGMDPEQALEIALTRSGIAVAMEVETALEEAQKDGDAEQAEPGRAQEPRGLAAPESAANERAQGPAAPEGEEGGAQPDGNRQAQEQEGAGTAVAVTAPASVPAAPAALPAPKVDIPQARAVAAAKQRKATKAERKHTRSQAAKKAIQTRKANAGPLNIIQRIAAAGGMKDVGGDLRTIMGRPNLMVPVYGALRNERGVDPDMMRESLVESGFLPEGATLRDMYDAIDETTRGRPVFSVNDASAVVERDAARKLEQQREQYGDEPAADEDEGMIKDAGEKIGGSRADRWRARGLMLSDLEGMSGADASAAVTKQNVWRPDYAKMIEGGASPVAAALIKVQFDDIAAKPARDTPDGRSQFVRMMEIVRDEAVGVKTLEQAKALGAKVRERIGWYSGGMPSQEVRSDYTSLFRGRSDPLHIGFNEMHKAGKLVDAGFPAAVDPWTRRFSVRNYDGKWIVYGAGANKYRRLHEAATKEDAESWARAEYDRTKSAKAEGVEPERPHLDKIERRGADVRGGRDITSQEFIDEFGFRGVEFGNWAASDERQKAINLAYEGLHDLASVLKIPTKAISLNGSLGLALGARGGGRFAAHYEPGKLAINLTKLRGGGSLAHEWGHAVDHYLGELDRPDAYKASARGVSGWYGSPKKATNLRPELATAFDELMQTIFKRNKGKAERVRDAELDIEKTLAGIARQEQRGASSKEHATNGSDLQKKESARFIVQSDGWIAQQRRVLDIRRARLAELITTPDANIPRVTVNSSFLDNAIKLSGKSGADGYWARPTEMLARSFEAFVFDRTADQGNVSRYLVQGVEADRYASDKYRGNPYPTDDERKAINAAWSKVVATLKTREGKLGPNTALYQRPAVEKIDVATPAESSPSRPAVTAVAKRFDLTPDEVTSILTTAPEEMWRRDDWVPPSSTATTLAPKQVDFERFPIGSARMMGGRPSSPRDAWVYVLREFSPRDLMSNEVEDGITRTPTFRQYVEWAREGSEPPPISSVARSQNGKLVSTNRRRLLAAQEAGAKAIKGWFSPENREHRDNSGQPIELPLKYGDVIDAYREAERTPRTERIAVAKGSISDEQMVIPGAERVAADGKKAAKSPQRSVAETPLFGGPQAASDKTKGEDKAREAGRQGALFQADRDQTNAPEFRRWFGDSKVVDADGKPLVVYHGTQAEFSTFATERNKVAGEAGIFFTPDPMVASAYAGYDENFPAPTIGQVMPVYLRVQNPLVVDFRGGKYGRSDAIAKAIRDGHDGLLLKNHYDARGVQDQWVVFRPEQIKSATANSSAFDPANPDITAQAARASDGERLRVGSGIDAVARLTPRDQDRRMAVLSAVRLIVKRMTGAASPRVEAFDAMMAGDQEIHGAYSLADHLLAVSLRSPDPIGTARHETIHVLRNLGLIDDAAWSALEQAAETGDWLAKHEITERWGDQLTRRQALEEAVAEEFGVGLRSGVWKTGNTKIDAIFQRLAEFLRRVRAEIKRALARTGMRELSDADVAEYVFSLIERGAFRESDAIEAAPDADATAAAMYQMAKKGAEDAASTPEPQKRRFLNRAIANLRGGSLSDPRAKVRVPHDIGAARNLIVTPRTIGAYFPEFARVFRAGISQFQTRDRMIADLSDAARGYLDMPRESKAKINKVLEHGRMDGKSYAPSRDGTITVTNKIGQQKLGRIGGTTLMADGETVTLTPDEARAYMAYRATMDLALNRFRDQVLREWGFDPSAQGGPKTAEDVATIAKDTEDRAERESLKKLEAILGEIQKAQRRGYVPFTRHGRYYVTVTTLQDGKTSVIHREHIEPGLTTDPRAFGPLKKLTTPRLEQEAAALRKKLEALYPPDKGFEVSELREQLPDDPDDVPNFSDLDAIIQAAQLPPEHAEKMQQALDERMKARGFRAHFIRSRNIPGYSVDFERSLADYIVGVSGYLARREHAPEIENGIAAIPATQPNLKTYAKNWNKYIQNPSEEYQTLRQVGFFMYLGGRISSALVNLSQIPVVTMPWLSQFAGAVRTNAEIARAYKDATLAIRPKSKARGGAGMDVFDPDKLPEDVREIVKAKIKDGSLLPIETFEVMARARGRTPGARTAHARMRTVQDTLAYAFQAAERTNRLISFIAALRLARDPAVLRKADEALSKDGQWAEFRKERKRTAEDFAAFTVEETQFVQGKVNRSRTMRGPGSAILQFKSFALNYIEMLARLGFFGSGTHRGGQRFAAMAGLMFMLTLTSGIMGLPGADDGTEILEEIMRKLTGIDPQFERRLREAGYSTVAAIMKALGAEDETAQAVGAVAGRAVARGPLRESGVDVSQRIGQGRFIPQPSGTQFDGFWERATGLLGVPASLALRFPATLSNLWKGEFLSAGISASPEFIADTFRAKQLATEGVKTRARGQLVMGPDETLPDGTQVGGATNIIKRAAGFQPSGISRAREEMRAVQRAGTAARDLFAEYNLRLAKLAVAHERAEMRGDIPATRIAERRLNEAIAEIDEHNKTASPENRYDFKSPGLDAQIRQETIGQRGNSDKRAPRRLRNELGTIRALY